MSRLQYFPAILIFCLAYISCEHKHTGPRLPTDILPSYHVPASASGAVVLLADEPGSNWTLLLNDAVRAGINTVCVPMTGSTDQRRVHAWSDSCHARGLSLLLQLNDPKMLSAALVASTDVDGFRLFHAMALSDDAWHMKLDSTRAVKPLLIITDTLTDAMHFNGVQANDDPAFFKALQNVFNNEPLATLNDVAARRRFKENWRPSHYTRLFGDGGLPGDARKEEAAFVLCACLPSLPEISAAQFLTDTSFYGTFIRLYSNKISLQQGSLLFYDASPDVVVFERTFNDETIVVAVNVRDHESSFRWPADRLRFNRDWLFGETVNGVKTQTLQPYGCQILHVKVFEPGPQFKKNE